jgi:hypothetical protein
MLGNRGSRLYLCIRGSRRSMLLYMEDFVYEASMPGQQYTLIEIPRV